MIKHFIRNWPIKLAAIVLAGIFWFFVANDDTSFTNRSLIIPVVVDGVTDSMSVTSLPATVEVTVSGPSSRISRLRPENFDASINLTGLTGDFTTAIRVLSPQGVSLLRVNPVEVIGKIERTEQKTVPIRVTLRGDPPDDSVLNYQSSEQEIIIRGLADDLEQATSVLAPAQARAGEYQAKLYATDNDGQPVPNIELEFDTVQVTVTASPVLHSKRVPLMLDAIRVPSFVVSDVALSQDTLLVAGTVEALNTVASVPASVEPITESIAVGSYTLRVIPQLPDGVAALEQVSVSLQLTRPSLPE